MKQVVVDPSWTPIDRRAGRFKRLQQRTLTFANIVHREHPGLQCVMVTLTYAPDRFWGPRQVSKALRAYRLWCGDQGVRCRFTWVMELTKAGKPHFHVLLWLPRHLRVPKWDKAGWWPHGMTRTEVARFGPGYLAKYASKGVSADEGQTIPKGARLHGCGGLDGDERTEARWWAMPRWMRESVKWMGKARRAKGGWICTTTGEFFPTPYEVMFSRGVCWFRLKCAGSLEPLRSALASAETAPCLSAI